MRAPPTCALVLSVAVALTPAVTSAQQPPPPVPSPMPPPGQAPYGSPPSYYPPPQYAYSPVPPPPEEIADEGQAVPWGYRRVTKTRKGPVIAGSITLGFFYVLALPAADNRPVVFLPVLGPLIGAQQKKCDGSGNDYCLGDGLTRAWLYVAFAGQLTGGILLAVGMSSDRKVFLRNDVEAKRTWTLAPLVTQQSQGAALLGTF